eukprot:11947894-Alexandrium_andersonii.AAC.1
MDPSAPRGQAGPIPVVFRATERGERRRGGPLNFQSTVAHAPRRPRGRRVRSKLTVPSTA